MRISFLKKLDAFNFSFVNKKAVDVGNSGKSLRIVGNNFQKFKILARAYYEIDRFHWGFMKPREYFNN